MSNEYDIAQIYKEMEQELISSMQRNLAGHIEEEKKVGFDFPQWQSEKLRSLRKYQIENAKIINSYTDGLPSKVKEILKNELKQGSLQEIEKFKEALAAGYESSVIMNESFFKINTRKVNSLIKSIDNDLHNANQACLRYTDDAYRKVIFKSEMYAANGVFTEKKAVEKAIEDFAKQGIHCIEYADGSRRDIADYADMAIKTASQRAFLMGEGEMRKKIGNTLIRISKHGGTCPLCAKWEDRILIDDVYSGGTSNDGDYPLLSEAMAAGLYHPRCRHGCGTYYPEIDDIFDNSEISQKFEENKLQKQGKSIANKTNSGIINEAARSPYNNTEIEYNPNANYEIKLKDYSDEVCKGISNECRNVAELGYKDNNEHLALVNLSTGKTEYIENGSQNAVGGTEFWQFIKNNKEQRYAFVHNHNTLSEFSERDMMTLTDNNSIKMFVISRYDGKVFIVESNGIIREKAFFDDIYQQEINELSKKLRSGEIEAADRARIRETILVNNAIRDYTKGVKIFG